MQGFWIGMGREWRGWRFDSGAGKDGEKFALMVRVGW